MEKRRILKDWVSYMLFAINTCLVLLDVMLLAELNTCFLFYSITVNVIMINTIVIHKYGSKKFNEKYMNIFAEGDGTNV